MAGCLDIPLVPQTKRIELCSPCNSAGCRISAACCAEDPHHLELIQVVMCLGCTRTPAYDNGTTKMLFCEFGTSQIFIVEGTPGNDVDFESVPGAADGECCLIFDVTFPVWGYFRAQAYTDQIIQGSTRRWWHPERLLRIKQSPEWQLKDV